MAVASLLIAGSALALSLWLYARDVRSKRAASFEARLERYRDVWPDGRPKLEHRLVVVNHGPARACDVTVDLVDQHGDAPKARLLSDWHLLPIPMLHPTQTST